MAGPSQSNQPDPRFKNPVWETMTTLRFAKYKVRVWCKVSEWTMGPNTTVQRLPEYMRLNNIPPTADEINRLLCLIPEVVALEITDTNGDGGLYYPDWS